MPFAPRRTDPPLVRPPPISSHTGAYCRQPPAAICPHSLAQGPGAHLSRTGAYCRQPPAAICLYSLARDHGAASPKFQTYEVMTWSRHVLLLALTRPSSEFVIDQDSARCLLALPPASTRDHCILTASICMHCKGSLTFPRSLNRKVNLFEVFSKYGPTDLAYCADRSSFRVA